MGYLLTSAWIARREALSPLLPALRDEVNALRAIYLAERERLPRTNARLCAVRKALATAERVYRAHLNAIHYPNAAAYTVEDADRLLAPGREILRAQR